jgi:hypothetical protein
LTTSSSSIPTLKTLAVHRQQHLQLHLPLPRPADSRHKMTTHTDRSAQNDNTHGKVICTYFVPSRCEETHGVKLKSLFFCSFELEKTAQNAFSSSSFFTLFFLSSPHGLHMRKPKSSNHKRKAFQNLSLQSLQLYLI